MLALSTDFSEETGMSVILQLPLEQKNLVFTYQEACEATKWQAERAEVSLTELQKDIEQDRRQRCTWKNSTPPLVRIEEESCITPGNFLLVVATLVEQLNGKAKIHWKMCISASP